MCVYEFPSISFKPELPESGDCSVLAFLWWKKAPLSISHIVKREMNGFNCCTDGKAKTENLHIWFLRAKQSLEPGFPASQLNVDCWLMCL